MTTYLYCTPEWFQECFNIYQSNPAAKEKLKKLTAKMVYRVKAEPLWGIDKDVLFAAYFDAGELTKLELVSERIPDEVEFLMAATPQTWKKILRKERKFLTDFMLGNIKLEKGSKVGVLRVAPHANSIVDAITTVELLFPDDLSSEDREKYRISLESNKK
jgi:putative sterol carrier protein